MNMQYIKMIVSVVIGGAIAVSVVPERTRYVYSMDRESFITKYRPLDEYILDHMKSRNARLSPAASIIFSRQFARILESGLSDRDDQEAFVLAVGNESHFNPRATSPTGARGVAQIIPSYANDFARLAGLGQVSTEDLYDTEVSLTLGVALFRDLLRQANGNRALALAYYNQGTNGPTAKAAKRGDINGMAAEGVGYLAKQYLVMETERVRTKQ